MNKNNEGLSEGTGNNYFNSVNKKISVWVILASSLPMIALAILGTVYIFGFDTILNIATTLIISIFLICSIIWWWWSAFTIVKISSVMMETSHNLQSVKHSIKEIREELH